MGLIFSESVTKFCEGQWTTPCFQMQENSSSEYFILIWQMDQQLFHFDLILGKKMWQKYQIKLNNMHFIAVISTQPVKMNQLTKCVFFSVSGAEAPLPRGRFLECAGM